MEEVTLLIAGLAHRPGKVDPILFNILSAKGNTQHQGSPRLENAEELSNCFGISVWAFDML